MRAGPVPGSPKVRRGLHQPPQLSRAAPEPHGRQRGCRVLCEAHVAGGGLQEPLERAPAANSARRCIVTIFYPFSQFCEMYVSSEFVKTTENNPKSISEGGRIWQVCDAGPDPLVAGTPRRRVAPVFGTPPGTCET